MKLLVTGTFCSGKTTLANLLSDKLDSFVLVPDICREMLDLFPRIDWTTPALRDYLIVRQLFCEKELCTAGRNSIIDSGIVGNLAHDRLLLSNPVDRTPLINHLDHDRYDRVLHCDFSEIPLFDDGQRFTDAVLRARLNTEVLRVLDYLGYHQYLLLTGSPEQRLAQASEFIL